MSLYLPCGILLNLVALIQCLLLVFDPSLQDCKEDTALVRISYWLHGGIVLALGNCRFTVILFGNVNWMVMRYWHMVKAGQARHQRNHEAVVFRKVLLTSKAIMKNTIFLVLSLAWAYSGSSFVASGTPCNPNDRVNRLLMLIQVYASGTILYCMMQSAGVCSLMQNADLQPKPRTSIEHNGMQVKQEAPKLTPAQQKQLELHRQKQRLVIPEQEKMDFQMPFWAKMVPPHLLEKAKQAGEMARPTAF